MESSELNLGVSWAGWPGRAQEPAAAAAAIPGPEDCRPRTGRKSCSSWQPVLEAHLSSTIVRLAVLTRCDLFWESVRMHLGVHGCMVEMDMERLSWRVSK